MSRKKNFKLLEPMLTALKRGDREAIARYDDIRPFHDHIQDIFFKAVPDGGGGNALTVRPQEPVTATDPTSALQQVRQSLSSLGLAPDMIELALSGACAQVESKDPFALMAAALMQMGTSQPVTASVNQAIPLKSSVSRPKGKPVLQERDVRMIVFRGREADKDAHQTLREAGLITPVEQLYRVS